MNTYLYIHAVGTQWLVVMLADSYFAGMTPKVCFPVSLGLTQEASSRVLFHLSCRKQTEKKLIEQTSLIASLICCHTKPDPLRTVDVEQTVEVEFISGVTEVNRANFLERKFDMLPHKA